uniref:Not1 domain-containing protein n=1 Tax=Brugia timori TaxID=42155 RepID=A0A0R3R4M3_9BILA
LFPKTRHFPTAPTSRYYCMQILIAGIVRVQNQK